MVSEKGARSGDGDFQRRNQLRRDNNAASGALDHLSLGLEIGFFSDWSAGFRVARAVVLDLSPARRAPTLLRNRAAIYSWKSTRASRKNWMAAVASSSADLGVCDGQIHY